MRLRLRLLFILMVVALPLLGRAQQPGGTVGGNSIRTYAILGFETVGLPMEERVGLVGGSLLFDIGGAWDVGPAVYAAATGSRGGFFVGGIGLRRRWEIGRGLALATDFFVGGGGGAAAPVGSGLMLRPALTLFKDLGPSMQVGLSWSRVSFPSGDIRSSQLGVALAWRDEFRHFAGSRPGDAVAVDRFSGLGFDRTLATLGYYRLQDGSARRIGLAGARAERRTDQGGLTWGIEAAAAASGNAAGYMEILGTLGASTALLAEALPSWRVGLRVGGGLGGGGAVPVGGGLLGKAAATTEWKVLPGWTLGAELGVVRGANSTLHARHTQFWLGIDLEPGWDVRGKASGHIVRTEWTGVLQHHVRSARKDSTQGALDTIGLKLSRHLGDHGYITGQAYSAYAGAAGAYSIGLVGAGAVASATSAIRIGVELLAGSAGGGGVQTAGGAVLQGLAWAGWTPRAGGEWRVGIGEMRSLRGGLNSPILELSWTRAFDISGP